MNLLRVGIVACVLPIVVGCGAVGDPGPEKPSAGQGGAGGAGNGGKAGGGDYPWSLPEGDPGANPAFAPIYELIRTGRCAEANRELDRLRSVSPGTPSYLPFNERTLLRAGAALCGGDKSAALRYFRDYRWRPGSPGERSFECHLYVASGSVLLRRPRSSFADCPPLTGGSPSTPGPPGSPPDTPAPDTPPPDGPPPESPAPSVESS